VSTHTVAVVIPVYRGERTLARVVEEVLASGTESTTPSGLDFEIREVVLVHDCGPDRSDEVIRELCESHPKIHPVWLTRNFGQHAATMAGIAATGTDWVVTLDEDGQFDPRHIPQLLDTAIRENAVVVYARPSNRLPHSVLRNTLTEANKRFLAPLIVGRGFTEFSSFRLILGEIARSMSAYAGYGTYLDVVLSWITDRRTTIKVEYRGEERDRSGYSFRTLLQHFGRMIITGGTRPLRIVSISGLLSALFGTILAVAVVFRRFAYGYPAGFASVFVILLVLSGLTLVAVGVLAEYVGAVSRVSQGRPLYSTWSDPAASPLRRDDAD
jgi:glycosyltransferase involved in cell wall biosynthesis